MNQSLRWAEAQVVGWQRELDDEQRRRYWWLYPAVLLMLVGAVHNVMQDNNITALWIATTAGTALLYSSATRAVFTLQKRLAETHVHYMKLLDK